MVGQDNAINAEPFRVIRAAVINRMRVRTMIRIVHVNTLHPDLVPVSVTFQWGGKSNNRSRYMAHGSMLQVSRLLPGIRYLERTRANKKAILAYVKAWESWCRGR